MEDAETLSDTRVVHPSKLTLLAIWPDGRGRAYPLPDRGHVSIGRSSTCDLQIKDESLSRTHAVLNLNGEITIEDKGSRNGSRFRGSVLPPHRQQRIEVGDTFEFGNILLILQMRPSPPRHSTTAGVSESFIERVARGEISVLVLG